MNKQSKKLPWAAILLPAALLSAWLGLRYGSTGLTALQVLEGLLRLDPQSSQSQILWAVRLPHVAACLLAGAGLAVSGLLLQTATNNPLAGPNIIGVNAGAGFAVVLGLCCVPMAYRFLPLFAFGGALAATALILLASNWAGGARVTVVLAGVAISTLLSAGISMLKLLFPDLAVAYTYFSVGGVSGVTFAELLLPGVIILAVYAVAQLFASRLDLLCLGDSIPRSLGVNVRLIRALALVLASAAAGAAVSFAGLLGFVGLMVPHIARQLTGNGGMKRLLPICALLGGTLVTVADLLGRVLVAPSELPAGIITAIIGAPFFFVLLLQRRNRLWN